MIEKPKRKRRNHRPRSYILAGILLGVLLTSAIVAFVVPIRTTSTPDVAPANGLPDHVTATLNVDGASAQLVPNPTVIANRLLDVAVAPDDGELMVVGWNNGQNRLSLIEPRVADSLSGDVRVVPTVGVDFYDQAHYSPDGDYIAFSSQSLNRVDIYDADTLTLVNQIRGSFVVAYSPDGTQLAVAGNGSNILIFDPSGAQLRNNLELEHTVFAMAYSPDSVTLAVAYYDNGKSHVITYNSESARRYPAFYVSGNYVYALAFHPSGNILAVATDNNVQVIYINEGEQRFYSLTMLGRVRDVLFSPDGAYLVASGGETGGGLLGQIVVWTLPEAFGADDVLPLEGMNGDYRHLTGHAHDVNGIAFIAPDRLVSASSDGSVRLWDLATGLEISRAQF